MERSCHACGVTSGGFGTKNRTINPIDTEIIKGTIFAPCGGGGFDSAGEEEARMVNVGGFLEMGT